MHIYRVGGAVRDRLLQRPIGEIDWVVVGATADELLAQGFKPVGKDFPVFLHPSSHEEYALARQERKVAKGYHGFELHHPPSVTLEEDLLRRDLTINAMAEDDQGRLIDPYGGQRDLDRKLLRHVSEAFVEDPVRILRVARFLARFKSLGFSIAPETIALMQQMVAAGEVDALQAERVVAEMQKALREPNPEAFFECLRSVGALHILMPELDRLFGVPQPPQWHPEIDTGVHVLMALTVASRLSPEPRVRFAALMHDLGKGLTPPAQWPKHIGHEASGARLVRELCDRLRMPNDYKDLAVMVTQWHTLCHQAMVLTPERVLKLFDEADAYRRADRFEEFLLACCADFWGRLNFEQRPYPQADVLRSALVAAKAIKVADLALAPDTPGIQIAKALARLRLERVSALLAQRPRSSP